MSKFYGDKKIKSIEEKDGFVIVDFGDDTIKVSKKMFAISATKKPTDLTNLWDKQTDGVARDILKVMLDWDIELGQLDYLFNKLKTSIEHNLGQAGDMVWGKKMTQRTMSDIDTILKNGNGKQ